MISLTINNIPVEVPEGATVLQAAATAGIRIPTLCYVEGLQSIGACIQNMLLAIHESGLGGVWLGEILKSGSEVKSLLQAPDAYEFMAAVAVGHPDGKPPRAPARRPVSELVFYRK